MLNMLLIILLLAGGGNPPNDQIEQNISIKAINTKDEAIAAAIRYTGFDKINDYDFEKNASANPSIPQNDSTPFINNIINDKSVWIVEFNGINPKSIYGAGKITNNNPMNFSIMIDSASGLLLKIYSTDKDPSRNISRPRYIHEYADRMRQLGNRYENLPNVHPASILAVFQAMGLEIEKSNYYEILYIYFIRDSSGLLSAPTPVWLPILYEYPGVVSSPMYMREDSTRIGGVERQCHMTRIIGLDAFTCGIRFESRWSEAVAHPTGDK